MAVKKIGLSWIMASDISKSKKFFADILGLQIGEGSSEEYGWLELIGKDGGSYLGVGHCNEQDDCTDVNPGQNAVITFTVDNLEQSIEEFKAKGVEFIDEIVEIPGHVKMITFVDPDDNKFQLVEELGE